MSTARRGVLETMLPAGSIADELSGKFSINPVVRDLVVYATGTGAINAGVITIEEAPTEEHAGAWSEIDTFTATDLANGATQAMHLEGTYGALRARISTAIGVGSVEVLLKCSAHG